METLDSLKELEDVSITSRCNRIGLVVSASLAGFFFLMRAFGLHEILMLRTFNFVFLLIGIIAAIKQTAKSTEGKIDYFKGMKIGIHVSLAAIIPFSFFVLCYLSIDPAFMHHIRESISGIGAYLTPGSASGAIFVEGLISGVIITYCVMPYFKRQ